MKSLPDSIRKAHWVSSLCRRLHEQCPGPLTESNPKGWAMPDPLQRRLRLIDRLYDCYRQVLPVNDAVDTIRYSVFDGSDGDLSIETECTQAFELLQQHFQSRGHSEAVQLDPHYTVHDFLSGVASALLLIGRVYYSMVWSDDGKRLVRIRRLPVETMRTQRKGGRIWRHKQQYSIFTTNELIQRASPGVSWQLQAEVCGTTFCFAPDEVFFLEWPARLTRHRGYPPARDAVRHVRRWTRFWDRMGLHVRAMTHREIRDCRHLRARTYDVDEELRRHRRTEARIRAAFHVVQDVPKTPYYDVWQLKKMLQFVGDIREFLLDAFNSQVVCAILERNGIDADALFVCKDKLTNAEIEERFERYSRGDISDEEAVQAMLKARPGSLEAGSAMRSAGTTVPANFS